MLQVAKSVSIVAQSLPPRPRRRRPRPFFTVSSAIARKQLFPSIQALSLSAFFTQRFYSQSSFLLLHCPTPLFRCPRWSSVQTCACEQISLRLLCLLACLPRQLLAEAVIYDMLTKPSDFHVSFCRKHTWHLQALAAKASQPRFLSSQPPFRDSANSSIRTLVSFLAYACICRAYASNVTEGGRRGTELRERNLVKSLAALCGFALHDCQSRCGPLPTCSVLSTIIMARHSGAPACTQPKLFPPDLKC